MKKILTSVVALGLMASTIFPGAASALTLEENLKKIQDLTNQIKALQDQILNLRTQQAQLQTSTNDAIVELVGTLKVGSEGDQVKVLQTLLALDASIYPEGMVTGYFGPATRRAIERYQRRSGLETVGFVGPRTRAELNKWLREQFKAIEKIEDDVADDVKAAIAAITLPALPSDPCGIPNLPYATSTPFMQKDGKTKIIQTGNVFIYKDGKHKIIITPNTYHEKDGKKQLLITPGMRVEKDGKYKSIIPCNGATTTPPTSGSDTTPPTISSVNSTPAHNSAKITWNTNEGATGKVYYGTANPLNIGSASSVAESTWWSLPTGHSVTLTSLSASTTYYFVIESKDKKGNTATSSQHSFTTSQTPDSTDPVITAISSSGVGTSTVTINWTTNESANSKVYYSGSTPVSTGSAATKSDGAMVTHHSLQLTGLTPGTTYYFKVESSDASGNSTLSSETSFATAALDTTAPIISAIVKTPAATTTAVTWTTNEAATSKIYYGTITPLLLGAASTVSDSALLTNHSLMLSGLTASTTYYMVVESKDAANNTATSSEISFTTVN